MFKKLKKKWYYVLIVVALLVWGVSRITGDRDGGEKVAVGKVVKRTITESVNASGKVYPEVEVKISPDISGEITELNVEEGDSVTKGRCWLAFMPISMPYSAMRRVLVYSRHLLRCVTHRKV